MYTSLSPCDMCTGACVLYKVARVVIGENKTFVGGEEYLKQRGIEVVVLEDETCKELMRKFIAEKPAIWYVVLQLQRTQVLTLSPGMKISVNNNFAILAYVIEHFANQFFHLRAVI